MEQKKPSPKASAKRIVKKVERIVTDETPMITLEMTPADAEVLQFIFYSVIGGDPTGPRAAVDRLYSALSAAGVQPAKNVIRSSMCYIETKKVVG